jgi:glycosyltransferase involved in cell wall biosynthesis
MCRVLLIAPEPFFEIRGTPIATREMVRALKKLGYDVDLFVYPLGEDVVDFEGNVIRGLKIPFIRNVPIGFSLRKIFLDSGLFLKILWHVRSKKNRNSYRVIQAGEESLFIGIILKKVLHIPLIYDMDSILSEQLNRTWLGRIPVAKRIYGFVERMAIGHADAIFAVAPFFVPHIRRISPEVPILRTNDFPITDVEEEHSSNGETGELSELCESRLSGKHIIMYGGNLEDYQGIDMLLKAFSLLHGSVWAHTHFPLIVGGKDRQVERYRTVAADLGIGEWVHFTGEVSPRIFNLWIDRAAILVSPRRTGTNTPMKLYTYLQSGNPLIATRIPAHESILDETCAILVDVSPEGIYRGLLRALEHPDQAKKTGREGRKLIERKYSKEHFRAEVKRGYNLVLAIKKYQT